MAKTSKDFTTWTKGISNATEPSDEGDEAGTFSLKNLDGSIKKGVLRPAGRMKDYPTKLELYDQTNTVAGTGFEIISLDYDMGQTEVFNSTSINMENVIDTGNSNFTLGVNSMIWGGLNSATENGTFDNVTSGPDLEADTWYSYEMRIVRDNNSVARADLAWVALDRTAYGDDNTRSWSELGFPASGDVDIVGAYNTRGIFKSVGGRTFGLDFYGNSSGDDTTITISNIVITKLATPGSHEMQLIQSTGGGNNIINIYQDGGDADGVIGSTIDTIILGERVGNPSLQYLKTSNAIRISDGNFENTYPTKFFGFIDREFFKDIEHDTQEWDVANYDSVNRPFGIKRKYWVEEDAKLIKPNPANCTMPCLGDVQKLKESTGAVTSDVFWHRDLDENLEATNGKYLLRLEYEVIKETFENQSGNWNAAEDGQDGTNVTPAEKNVRYKFYCSFAYDRGAQESELTQITNILEQGSYWNGTAYVSDGYKTSAGKDEIQLYYHDSSACDLLEDNATHNTKAKCEAEDTTAHATGGATGHWLGDAEGQREAHTYQYQPHLAWDCKVAFRPTIIPSEVGAAAWRLPERCTGVNWYYATSEDGYNKKYRLIETEFVDGVKFHSSASEDYVDWKLFMLSNAYFTSTEQRYLYSINNNGGEGARTSMEDPPQTENWNDIYGMKSSQWPDIRYKTAVAVGGQGYYGHVKVDTEIHRDRVLVSIGNHGYDMIPHDNFLDVVPGDGDEIVHLLSYSNQLYVFKKNKLVICDVGGEEDSVASEHLVGGINSKHQACVTSKGIFWVNEHGAFLASGEANNIIVGKISTETREEDITNAGLTFTANSTTVTHGDLASKGIVPGTEVVSNHIGGRVGIVSSVTDNTECELVDKAISGGYDTSSIVREGATNCFWSIRTSDKPVVGYDPRSERVFILSATLPDMRKHFWIYDLNDESFWYHDGHYIITAGSGNYTNASDDITHAANTEIERGMMVFAEGSDNLVDTYVKTLTSDTATEMTVNASDTVGDSSAVFKFVGGSFRTIDTISNFALDSRNRLCVLAGDTNDTVLKSRIRFWDKSPSIQNVLYDSGLLDLGSPSTLKQLYKVTFVCKNASTGLKASMYGISPKQSTLPNDIAEYRDGAALFGLNNSTGLNTYDAFRATHHDVAENIDSPYLYGSTYSIDEERQIAANSLFFRLVLESTEGSPAADDFELHSITFVYRDKGIK